MVPDSLQRYIDRRVVLDTQGPLIFIGTLRALDPTGYWLADADVHDRNDGHSSKEVYINNAYELERSGTRNVNRRTVFVDRAAVVSISALDDVVVTSDEDDGVNWLPA